MMLHFYFARRFVWVFLGGFAIFTVLQLLLDLVEQLRKFSGDSVSFRDVLALTLLKAPGGLYAVMPLIMILATLFMFLGLARSSELVVTRAAGRSAVRSLFAPSIVALLVGAITIAVFNPFVAATSKRYAELFDIFQSGGSSTASVSGEGLWLRQGDADGQTVIRAASSNPDASVLYDVTFVEFSSDGTPKRRIEASRAELGGGAWVVNDAKSWPLDEGVNPEQAAQNYASLTVSSTLTPERIRDSFGEPASISIWDLPSFIDQLEEAGFSARRHTVWLQMELARPLFLLSMVLIGAGFTMRHTRFGNTGIMVVSALLFGFGLYYIRNFAQILGENGQLNLYLAAWTPPIAGIMAALGLILHLEDG